MTVIPGLSLPLKAVGKRIKGWDESGDCLQVEVSVPVRRAAIPSYLHRSSQVHGPEHVNDFATPEDTNLVCGRRDRWSVFSPRVVG
jgi:hypothetical protein